MNKGEGISQKTHMKDLWTWMMVKGLIMEERDGLGGGGPRGKKWDNCNSINKI